MKNLFFTVITYFFRLSTNSNEKLIFTVYLLKGLPLPYFNLTIPSTYFSHQNKYVTLFIEILELPRSHTAGFPHANAFHFHLGGAI